MDLRSAIKLGASYAGKEGPESTILLSPGWIRATNGRAGVEVPCDACAVDAAVEAAALVKMVGALKEPDLSVKGRKLIVKGGGSTYKLALRPSAQIPTAPARPTAGWRPVGLPVLQAVAAAAGLVDEGSHAVTTLKGVRLAPTWVAGSSGSVTSIVWAPGLVDAPFTSAKAVFKSPPGACELAVAGRRLWLVFEDHARWAQGLEFEWPDSQIHEITTGVRRVKQRAHAEVDAPGLERLCRQAAVVADSRAHVWELTLSLTGTLRLTGGPTTQTFDGGLQLANGGGEADGRVGISAPDLMRASQVAAAVPGVKYIAVGDAHVPVLIWGGDPVVEVITTAMYLPPVAP